MICPKCHQDVSLSTNLTKTSIETVCPECGNYSTINQGKYPFGTALIILKIAIKYHKIQGVKTNETSKNLPN